MIELGDVFYTSWGYDQTNVEFFEVVRETEKSVVLRRLKTGDYNSEGPGSDRVYPATGPDRFTIDYHLEGNPGTPSYERDRARGYSEKLCRKPRGGGRSLRIDDVRFAYPYTGGGRYETAFGWGH